MKWAFYFSLLIVLIIRMKCIIIALHNGYNVSKSNISDTKIKCYIQINMTKTINVSFFTNNIDDISENIQIISYDINNQVTLEEKNQSISPIPFDNGYLYLISYKNINSSTRNLIYFILELPKKKIDFILVHCLLINGVYDLYNGESKNITHPIDGGKYIFYLPIKQGQKVNIKLAGDKTRPFYNKYIYELKNKNDSIQFNPRFYINNFAE